MNTLFGRFLITLLVISLAACSSPGAIAAPPLIELHGTLVPPAIEKRTSQVALILGALTDPYYSEMERGAREAERQLGVKLVVRAAAQATAVEQQIELVEELLASDSDALIVAPVDSTRIIPVLHYAQDAGVVVINLDNPIQSEVARSQGVRSVPYVGTDYEEAGYLLARRLSAEVDGPARAAIILGPPGALSMQQLKTGALRGFAESPLIRVGQVRTAHGKIDEAYRVTQEIFTAQPETDLLLCGSDLMALGALEYLDKNDRWDVLVAGFNGLAEARRAVNEGRMVATIDPKPYQQGYQAVLLAVRALEGDYVPLSTLVDLKIWDWKVIR